MFDKTTNQFTINKLCKLCCDNHQSATILTKMNKPNNQILKVLTSLLITLIRGSGEGANIGRKKGWWKKQARVPSCMPQESLDKAFRGYS